jgi:phosphatidylserine decarboxylase
MRLVIFARYGLGTLFICLLLLGAAGAALYQYAHPAAVAGPAVLALFCLWFFRDPERTPPAGEGLVLSPADGTVVDIEEVDEPDYLGGKALRVGIFLSVFNVHVNRSPLAGTVGHVKYRPGRFLAAFNEKASLENESNAIGLETAFKAADGKPLRVLVKQIAGIIARRIVCACQVSQGLMRGERFGMIKFGSRTELYLPVGSVPGLKVKIGDRVRGGLTVIGVLRGEDAES